MAANHAQTEQQGKGQQCQSDDSSQNPPARMAQRSVFLWITIRAQFFSWLSSAYACLIELGPVDSFIDDRSGDYLWINSNVSSGVSPLGCGWLIARVFIGDGVGDHI